MWPAGDGEVPMADFLWRFGWMSILPFFKCGRPCICMHPDGRIIVMPFEVEMLEFYEFYESLMDQPTVDI
jgi:hypothetical protein